MNQNKKASNAQEDLSSLSMRRRQEVLEEQKTRKKKQDPKQK